MPDGWAASAGGFPAMTGMTGNVPFLLKDVVLLAVSVYLLKQDALRIPDPGRSCVDAGGCGSAASLCDGRWSRAVRPLRGADCERDGE